MKKVLLILTVLFLGSLPFYCFANHGLDISMGQSERLQALRDNQVGDNYLQDQLGSIVGVVLSFVGLLFLILLIYAGILWMTASGNDQQVEKSRKIIVWALAGLIIVFASFSLVQFLGDRATSSIGADKETEVLESNEGSSIE